MSPEQCRAARGWLGWTQSDLAQHANVGLSTIKSFEAADRVPIANNLTAIRRALEAEGIELLFEDSGTAKGVAGRVADVVGEKRPPQDAAPRRSGPQGRQAASPKRRARSDQLPGK